MRERICWVLREIDCVRTRSAREGWLFVLRDQLTHDICVRKPTVTRCVNQSLAVFTRPTLSVVIDS